MLLTGYQYKLLLILTYSIIYSELKVAVSCTGSVLHVEFVHVSVLIVENDNNDPKQQNRKTKGFFDPTRLDHTSTTHSQKSKHRSSPKHQTPANSICVWNSRLSFLFSVCCWI
jgi:hypothetical protein